MTLETNVAKNTSSKKKKNGKKKFKIINKWIIIEILQILLHKTYYH